MVKVYVSPDKYPKKTIQKTPPIFKYDSFKVIYKQVLYDDRYYFVYHNKDADFIMKIPANLFQRNYLPNFDPMSYWVSFTKFLDRVEAHDRYLDSLNETT